MKFRIALLSVVTVAGLGLGATSANAVGLITGSISFGGGFDCACFVPGTVSIVSQLTMIAQESPADTSGDVGDYAGEAGTNNTVTQFIDLLAAPLGHQPVYATANGFEFWADAALGISRTAMTCSGGICQDSLRFFLTGVVRRAGFDDTAFAGIWTGQGSCVGSAGVCTSQPIASWSASLSSPAYVPEPGSLALLGLGLAGLGLSRRRKA